MKREKVLKDTIDKLQQLDEANLREANDFVYFLLHKVSDAELTDEIQKQAQEGKSFDFLNEEEELYSIEDLKEENRS
jgi:hypothetical protein